MVNRQKNIFGRLCEAPTAQSYLMYCISQYGCKYVANIGKES